MNNKISEHRYATEQLLRHATVVSGVLYGVRAEAMYPEHHLKGIIIESVEWVMK
jgi:hypothetical protein